MKLQKSVCIETLYTELPFYERIEAAKKDKFDYFEFWGWQDKDLELIKKLSEKNDIKVAGFNGDASFSLIDPNKKVEYMDYLKKSVEAAKTLNAQALTIHSNGLGEGGIVINDYRELSDTVKICTMYENLKSCANLAEENDIQMNLEMLNISMDHVGNYLITTRMAAELTRLVDSPYIKILYDVYHMQLNEGSICNNIATYIDQIGHVHVADAPKRTEPGTGEINYPNVFKCLRENGYEGLIGYELYPLRNTAEAVKAIMLID